MIICSNLVTLIPIQDVEDGPCLLVNAFILDHFVPRGEVSKPYKKFESAYACRKLCSMKSPENLRRPNMKPHHLM